MITNHLQNTIRTQYAKVYPDIPRYLSNHIRYIPRSSQAARRDWTHWRGLVKPTLITTAAIGFGVGAIYCHCQILPRFIVKLADIDSSFIFAAGSFMFSLSQNIAGIVHLRDYLDYLLSFVFGDRRSSTSSNGRVLEAAKPEVNNNGADVKQEGGVISSKLLRPLRSLGVGIGAVGSILFHYFSVCAHPEAFAFASGITSNPLLQFVIHGGSYAFSLNMNLWGLRNWMRGTPGDMWDFENMDKSNRSSGREESPPLCVEGHIALGDSSSSPIDTTTSSSSIIEGQPLTKFTSIAQEDTGTTNYVQELRNIKALMADLEDRKIHLTREVADRFERMEEYHTMLMNEVLMVESEEEPRLEDRGQPRGARAVAVETEASLLHVVGSQQYWRGE